MLNVYTVIGFMTNAAILSSYELKVSIDGINYQYMYQNATVSNGADITYWLEKPVHAKYWRLEPTECTGSIPFVKGDIIRHL